MCIKGGYILQPRIIDDSELMHDPPIVREVWLYLLRKVNHRKVDKFARGSGFFNLSDIADDLHWYVGYRRMKYSKPQLTKTLRRLRERNMIETTKATRGIFITVCKYDYYQDPKNYEGTAKETRRKSGVITKNKNDKNERIEEERVIAPETEFYPFSEFWDDYDKKVGERSKLEKKWENVSNHDRETIKNYLPKYKASEPDKKYRKNPETFLNNKSWNDEIIQQQPIRTNGTNGHRPGQIIQPGTEQEKEQLLKRYEAIENGNN